MQHARSEEPVKLLSCLIIFSIIILLLPIDTAIACSCAWVKYENGKYLPLEKEPALTIETIAGYPLIFSGMPIKMELEYVPGRNSEEVILNGMKVTFLVQKTWKGKKMKEITIHTGLGGGDCGFDFHLGYSYLVFPEVSEGEALPAVSTCDRTKFLSEAQQSLSILKEYQGNSSETKK